MEWKLIRSKKPWGTVESFKLQPGLLTEPVPNQEATMGWLSPEGILYGCAYGEHNELQAAIEHFFRVGDIVRAGWLGLNYSVLCNEIDIQYPIMPLTESQRTALTDWCFLYEIDLPDFMVDHPDEYYSLQTPPGF